MTIPLFLLFLRQIISHHHLVFPQESWAVGGLTNERTAGDPLICRCFREQDQPESRRWP
jgi:hypothetical protein